MNIVKVILATLVIFAAGVITGAFAVRLARVNQPPVAAAASSPNPRLIAPNTPFNRPNFLDRLTREAKLRPEQRERIEEILRESRQRTEPLVREFSPKVRAEVQFVREQILQVLDPEQRARFNQVMRPRANLQRPGGRAGSRPTTSDQPE